MRINELNEIKTQFRMDNNATFHLKGSSVDPLIKYLETHMEHPRIEDVAKLVGNIPKDKRAKYSKTLNLMAVYVLASQPESQVIVGASSDRDALVAALKDLCINNTMTNQMLATTSKVDNAFTYFMTALTKERNRVLYTQQHQMMLLEKLKDGTIALTADRIMNPAEYGAANAKDPFEKAARFVAKASSSFNGKPEAQKNEIVYELASKLRDMCLAHFRINSPEGVLKLHEELVGKFVAGKNIRTMNIQASVPTLSDKLGHSMMLSGLRAIEKFPITANLGLLICGEIINAHGFVDGNGRAARSALALCQLIASGGNRFDAPTTAYDEELHGLNHTV